MNMTYLCWKAPPAGAAAAASHGRTACAATPPPCQWQPCALKACGPADQWPPAQCAARGCAHMHGGRPGGEEAPVSMLAPSRGAGRGRREGKGPCITGITMLRTVQPLNLLTRLCNSYSDAYLSITDRVTTQLAHQVLEPAPLCSLQ